MRMLLIDKLKKKIELSLHGRSIKELSKFVVNILVIGSALTMLTYVLTNRLVSHYQDVFTTEVLPIIALQRDIEADLVNYAMLESLIRQSKGEAGAPVAMEQLAVNTSRHLNVLYGLVQNDSQLLAIKLRLDELYTVLADKLTTLHDLQLNKLRSMQTLRGFRQDTQVAVEALIILREGFSGKVALMDVMNQRSNRPSNHELLNADLTLGMKLAELTNNVSILLYVDNIDQLLEINSHDLSQNLAQVKKAIEKVKQISERDLDLQLKTVQLSAHLAVVTALLSNDAPLTRLIKERFSNDERLAEASISFKKVLVSIQGELTDMYSISEILVADSIETNEELSMLSSLLLFTLLTIFIFILVVLIMLITRQIKTPIESLNNTMKRLTSGELSARLPLEAGVTAEFKSVWEEFNGFVGNNEKVIQEQEMIIDNADIGIAWLHERQYVRVNNKILSMFNYSTENFLGQNSLFLYPNKDAYYELGDEAYPVLKAGKVYHAEQRLMRADGSVFWCKLSGKSTGFGDDKDSIWLFEDVTERKLAEEKLYQLANYDALTTLPNRSLFYIYLDEAIVRSKRNGHGFALFFIDLDRFKHINDSWGHEAGDVVLKEIARRVKSVVRESDVVARLGGDEFTLIIDDVKGNDGLERVARIILRELSRVILYQEKELFVGGSIGISQFPMDALDRGGLLNCADSAMYIAKQSGRNGFCFYSMEIGVNGEKFAELSQSLRKAVEHGQFELHYQPKIEMRTREMIGLEALIRWHKPGVGLVSPFEFIPVLEESGLMVEVGEWVIFEACRAIKRWLELGYNPGKVAVNLSERQFGNNKLIDTIQRAIQKFDISAEHLEFEITESLMMSDANLTMNTLAQIKKMGIDIAMDDFGTGYSSLVYLKRYPIDILKIDRAFVKDINDDANDAAIVDAIITLAKQLKLTVVAEGIETEAQYQHLKASGCDIAQGYLFSQPVEFKGVLELLEKGEPI